MALDLSQLGALAAELMEDLEQDHDDHRDAKLGTVAIVVEVEWDDGEHGVCSVEYRCSDPRRWIQHGLFAAAQRAVHDSSEEP